MNSRHPLVTAVLTTHNRRNLLPRALTSILNQTYKNIEVLVVDDGSTDGTQQYMEEVVQNYSNVKYLFNPSPKGACFSRNRGIKEAKGEFIAGLDDDDEWLPCRIEKFLKYYDSSASMLTTYDFIVTEAGSRTWEKKAWINLDDILSRNCLGNQGFIETSRIRNLGGFDVNLPSAQDRDMWTRIIQEYGPAKVIPEGLQILHSDNQGKNITGSSKSFKGYLMYYRKHKNQMTRELRKYQLFRLYYFRHKRMSFKRLTQFIVHGRRTEMVWYFIMHSKIKKLVKNILEGK